MRVDARSVGYLPIEILQPVLNSNYSHDLKESLSTGSNFNHDRWPSKPSKLMSTWIEYFQSLAVLAANIMRIFAIALEMPEHYFDDKTDRTMAFMRVINYPDQRDEPLPHQLRAREHTDYGTFTVIRSENGAGGLQACNRKGEWIDVVSTPDTFVVNIGDMMQCWTNNRWLSTTHRVVNPPTNERHTSRRQSIVFFHTPNEDAQITPLSSCCSPSNPPRYKTLLVGEYLEERRSRRSKM